MRGFQSRSNVDEVVELIVRRVKALGTEAVDLAQAAGRVLAAEVGAEAPVPAFDRAAMDGYAVRGEETFGASADTPIAFRRVGEARPGQWCEAVVGPGEAIQITTGSAIPRGADAVVKVESTRAAGETVWVVEATPIGRHVGRSGEDLAAGTVVLGPGRVLRPQDLGVLSAVGVREVPVVRRPEVAVIITGDELLPPGSRRGGSRSPT